jgi:pimeloyl-ACP methyl ester carboxylesterase
MLQMLRPTGAAGRYGVAVLPYDEAGAGNPVVLVHAGIADRSMWRDHLPWLADAGTRAIAVDLPGFGDAAIEGGPQAPWADVLETMQALGIGSAVLVGVSFGAAVALRAAAVAPPSASALALISPPPLDDDPSPALKAVWDAEEAALGRGDTDGAVAAVVEGWLQPGAPAALRERVAAMQRQAFELQAAAPEVTAAPDPLERDPGLLAMLDVPVLAAAGEHDMPDFKRGARELANMLPSCQLAMVPNAGHLVPLEAAQEFRELLLEFLDRAQIVSRPKVPGEV